MTNTKTQPDIRFIAIFVATSTAFTNTFTAPFELIKLRLQCMPQMIDKKILNLPYKGIFNCAKRVIAEEGFRALWKGNMTNILFNWSNMASKFILRDQLQKKFFKDKSKIGTVQQIINNTFIGALAGALSSLIVYSLDYTRTRLSNDIQFKQKQVSKQFNGIIDVYKKTWRSDGIVGFYRGFIALNIGNIIYSGLFFGLFDTIRNLSPREIRDKRQFHFLLGILLTIFSTFVVYPIDTIRRRMMMNSVNQFTYKGAIDCGRSIFKNQGIRPFYNGLLANFVCGIGTAYSLGLYESLIKNE